MVNVVFAVHEVNGNLDGWRAVTATVRRELFTKGERL
jgi:hypothetical protein